MRFWVEIIQETRKLVGNDFPILVKLTATEFFEGGQTFEETRIICKKLEQLGVDGIIVSGNIHVKADTMVERNTMVTLLRLKVISINMVK